MLSSPLSSTSTVDMIVADDTQDPNESLISHKLVLRPVQDEIYILTSQETRSTEADTTLVT